MLLTEFATVRSMFRPIEVSRDDAQRQAAGGWASIHRGKGAISTSQFDRYDVVSQLLAAKSGMPSPLKSAATIMRPLESRNPESHKTHTSVCCTSASGSSTPHRSKNYDETTARSSLWGDDVG